VEPQRCAVLLHEGLERVHVDFNSHPQSTTPPALRFTTVPVIALA
jgi:hypothetical protein